MKKRLSFILQGQKDDTNTKLLKICQFLYNEISHYNWTGFYFRNGEKEELILGPYVGAETDHILIPFGKGICGQVAVSGEMLVVPDVCEQDNYLACSLETKAEIVVPIFKNGKNIGQIDIDSHQKNPFTKQDEELLSWLCKEIAKIL